MDDKVVEDLDRAMRKSEENDAVKVVVITGGIPGVFVRHFDLKHVEETSRKLIERGAKFDSRSHVAERRIDLLLRRLEESEKIVIAAINGSAMGGGLELALACDFRLVEQGPYLLGLPEILIGMLPGAGGTQRLPRAVGTSIALEMILHGKRLSPDEALDVRLVHEVTTGPVLERAMARATELSKIPGKALGHAKRLIYNAGQQPLPMCLDLERSLFLDLLSSPEGLQMVTALNARDGDFQTA